MGSKDVHHGLTGDGIFGAQDENTRLIDIGVSVAIVDSIAISFAIVDSIAGSIAGSIEDSIAISFAVVDSIVAIGMSIKTILLGRRRWRGFQDQVGVSSSISKIVD